MISYYLILSDFLIGAIFFLWILFVIGFLSKEIYKLVRERGRSNESSSYLARKIIHIFGGGIFIVFPIVFQEIIIPVLFSFAVGILLYLKHLRKERFFWFQEKERKSEIIFCFSAGITIAIGWLISRSMWLGIIPVLFMAIGDGVTGIVRNLKYGKQEKYWEGSVAMFIVSAIIGGAKFGVAGIVAALAATLAEKSNLIDDNISIPFISLGILSFFYLFFPSAF
ncbi:dolichol kinase [bacterium]|nr:dolichol kinase [bacterium]